MCLQAACYTVIEALGRYYLIGDFSMARLNIPSRIREGISKLLSLDDGAFANLLATIKALPANVELIARLPTIINIPNVNSADEEKIATAVVSLHMLRAARDTPSGEFVDDVSQAIGSFDPAGQSEASKARLLKIVDVGPLVVSAKAFTILMDRERTMLTAKILTDLRYAFRHDIDQPPYGAVVIHTLKLSFHEQGEHREFLLALDDDDIETLRDALIERKRKLNFSVSNLRRRRSTI